MSAHMNRRRLSAMLLITSVVLLLGAVAINKVVDSPPADAAGGVDPGCATSVHFYSYDVENNFFGPASDGDVDTQIKELHTRRCQDPALTVAHAHVWSVPGFAELNGDEQFAAKTRELISSPDLWRTTVKGMEELEAGSTASIETMSGSYETLYMLDGVTDVPLIRKAAPDKPDFQVIRFNTGVVEVSFKLDCGFQPVAQEFPGIPPVDAPPPPHQPPPGPPPTIPPTTNTTVPGETTTTTVPDQTTTTTVPGCGRKNVWDPQKQQCVPALNGGTTIPPPPTTAPGSTTPTTMWTPPTAPPDTAPGNVTPTTHAPVIPDRPDSGDGATNTTVPPTTQAPSTDATLPPGGGTTPRR